MKSSMTYKAEITSFLKTAKFHGNHGRLPWPASFSVFAETGITNDKIIIGGVMDLEGRSRGLGQGMKDGIMAALSGKAGQGTSV